MMMNIGFYSFISMEIMMVMIMDLRGIEMDYNFIHHFHFLFSSSFSGCEYSSLNLDDALY